MAGTAFEPPSEAVRAALAAADQALADGDYTASVRRSVAAYELLLAQRPELMPAPPSGLLRRDGPLIPDMPRTMRAGPWPSTMGVKLALDQGKPKLTFEKERFSMSEAAAYYEYTRDLVDAAGRP
ncbi:MAG TPA: hypothetical protein VMV93_12655 [Chloroflexota bacterium]|nr:hypothetical protein [Chloroflexota bacterium]